MNIVVLQDYLRSGGTERQAVLLSDAFAREGHATTLLCFRPRGPLAPTLKVAELQALQKRDWGWDWFAPGLLGTLERLGPDCVLCLGRMANCHAGFVQERFPKVSVVGSMRTGKALPWLFRRSLRKVRHIVANSEEAAENLVTRYGVPNEKISAIANSLVFREPASAELRKAVRTRERLRDDELVLLNVAMFRPEKNQRELIELAAALPASLAWRLWLAGEGPTLEACKDFAQERGVAERVRFLGWVSDPTPLYAAADLAVHASTSEALSNFLIEAQSQGLPAVAYEAQGNAECVLPGETGFIVPQGERSAFRDAVARLAGENGETKALRADKARRFARERFDPVTQAKAYLALFEKLRCQ